MDRATLKATAKSQIKGNIGILFVITLVVTLVSGLVGCIPAVGSVAAALVLTPAFSIAMVHIYLNMAEGVKPEVKDLFAHFQEFWGAFKVTFLVGLFTGLWSMLFVIPGIVKSYSYAMAHFILLENPGMSCVDAITRSRQLMDGHKAELFVLRLSFIGWHFLCILTFGIGYLWLIPYQNAAEAAFYHNLTDPTPAKPREDDYDFSWMDQKEYL